MTEALIIDVCRTPRGIGKVGKGSLAHLHPQWLGATVLKAIKERNDLNTAEVDDIVWGTSQQKGQQGGDLGRMAALDAGYDIRSSAVTLDRFCGSGITSVNMAATSIMAGMEDCTIGGGTEMMSSYGAMEGLSPFIDSDNLRLRDVHPQPHQGLCGDAIASLEGIRPAGGGRAGGGVPAKRPARRRGGPLRQVADPGAQRGRQRGAGPRGVPPPPAPPWSRWGSWSRPSRASPTCRWTRRAPPSAA